MSRDFLEILGAIVVPFGSMFVFVYVLAYFDCRFSWEGTDIPWKMSGPVCQVQIDGQWRPAEIVRRVEK